MKVDSPLLIYRPNERPKLMFSPSSPMNSEVAEQDFWRLISILRNQLGNSWQNQWVESGVMNVSREFLPDFLKDGEDAERQTREMVDFLGQLTDEQRQIFAQIYKHTNDPKKLAELMTEYPELAAAINKRNYKKQSSNNLPSTLNTIIQELSGMSENPQDMTRREQLCRQGLSLLSRDRSPEMWASLQSELGKSLLLKMVGNREHNIEESISAYLLALEVFTRSQFPREWGLVNIALGPAYFERIKGEHTDNTEKAITILERAFEIINKQNLPLPWAMAKSNLSNIYSQRTVGRRFKNVELAIAAANQSLEVLNRSHTIYWAMAHNALANAYFDRIEGRHADNLEESIASALKALEFFTREETPVYWAMAQMNLGNAYLNRIKGQSARNIEEAIMAYTRALEFLSRQHSPREWAMVQNSLAIAYSHRIYSDEAENIEAAIQASNLALKVYSRENFLDQWAIVHNNLSNVYRRRIKGFRAENIEKAITLAQNVLEIRSRVLYPELWASAQLSLANAYGERINGNRAQNIEDSITAYLEVLEIYTKKDFPKEWALVHKNLAIGYRDRIRGNRAENIELAFSSAFLATEISSQKDFPQSWAGIQQILCVLYRERIEDERRKNIENSINAALLALKVFTRKDLPRRWAAAQHELGSAYFVRIEGDRSQNIERAIAAYQKALEIRTRESASIDWATTQLNLANAYNSRISGDRVQNSEEAVKLNLQALEVFTKEDFPEQWASIQSNFISVYRKRIKGDRSQNMERALEAAFRALEVYTLEDFPVKYAVTHNNLGNLYRGRTQGEYFDNIESAIDSFNCALQVYTQESFTQEWAKAKCNLAGTYAVRSRGDHSQNLETAIELLSNVLEVIDKEDLPEDWALSKMNLSTAYSQRVVGDRAKNIEAAIAGYSNVLEVFTKESFPERWALTKNNIGTLYSVHLSGEPAINIQTAVEAYSDALDVFKVDTLPQNCRTTATLLANLYANKGLWQDAVTMYRVAIEAAEVLYRSTIFQSSRLAELYETGDLYRRAAFAHAKTGNLREAVKILEQGKARGLREILERDRADLSTIEQQAPGIYQNYRTAIALCLAIERQERNDEADEHRPKLSELRDQAQQAQILLDRTVTEIRQITGYEDFLSLPTFEDVQRAIQDDCPLVYLITSPNGSLSLILSAVPEGISIQPIWQEAFTEDNLQTLLFGSPMFSSIDTATPASWFGAYSHQQTEQETWLATMDRVTEHLWSSLMAPIVTHLSQLDMNQAVLIPTGLLGFLPLHSAWTVDPTCPTSRLYALDTIQFSYIPNAQSLQAARAIAERTPVDSLLAIDEPWPVAASELPNSGHEVEAAIAAFPNHTLLHHEQATYAAVQALLPQHAALHFSGHGFAQLDSPLNSGLVMANDEILTLRDLLNLRLPGLRLAILSACETGLPGTQLPDEVISLPTGLLQAGVAGVVASFWFVTDISTMILLIRFYDFWQGQNHSATAALRKAQQWIRDTTNGEKLTYVQGLMQESSLSKIPESTIDYLYKSLILSHPDAQDFAHPRHWAAFSYVGI